MAFRDRCLDLVGKGAYFPAILVTENYVLQTECVTNEPGNDEFAIIPCGKQIQRPKSLTRRKKRPGFGGVRDRSYHQFVLQHIRHASLRAGTGKKNSDGGNDWPRRPVADVGHEYLTDGVHRRPS